MRIGFSIFMTDTIDMEFKRSKYSRRIRKKKRLGEFMETGFLINLYLLPDESISTDRIMDRIMDDFIKKIESKKMHCGGGGDDKKISLFVSRNKKALQKEEIEWLTNECKKMEGVKHVMSFPLIDVWHSDSDSYYEHVEKIEKQYE